MFGNTNINNVSFAPREIRADSASPVKSVNFLRLTNFFFIIYSPIISAYAIHNMYILYMYYNEFGRMKEMRAHDNACIH